MEKRPNFQKRGRERKSLFLHTYCLKVNEVQVCLEYLEFDIIKTIYNLLKIQHFCLLIETKDTNKIFLTIRHRKFFEISQHNCATVHDVKIINKTPPPSLLRVDNNICDMAVIPL